MYDNDKHDKLVYDNSTLCHICNEELGKDIVHDHCQLSGKVRGAAHDVCLKNKVPKFFTVEFHNFSGYHSHIFIKTLGNREGDISRIFLSRNRSSLTNLLIRKEKR